MARMKVLGMLAFACVFMVSTGAFAQTEILNVNFDDGLPAEWTATPTDPADGAWEEADQAAEAILTGGYMIADKTAYSDVDFDATLDSPAMDCSTYGTVTLSFDHFFEYTANTVVAAYVSADATTWSPVATYDASVSPAEAAEVDISTYAAGQAAVQVRFSFVTGAEVDQGYWAIDNVVVTGAAGADDDDDSADDDDDTDPTDEASDDSDDDEDGCGCWLTKREDQDPY